MSSMMSWLFFFCSYTRRTVAVVVAIVVVVICNTISILCRRLYLFVACRLLQAHFKLSRNMNAFWTTKKAFVVWLEIQNETKSVVYIYKSCICVFTYIHFTNRLVAEFYIYECNWETKNTRTCVRVYFLLCVIKWFLSHPILIFDRDLLTTTIRLINLSYSHPTNIWNILYINSAGHLLNYCS